ncbi:pyridine nucleotide-disulfide oxidoreductase, partial [Salmonella enterica subsp. enterica serovar Infantis]
KASVVNFLRDINIQNRADLDTVDVSEGRPEFINNHTLRVFQADGERELRGEKIFINTGTESVNPSITLLTTTSGLFYST